MGAKLNQPSPHINLINVYNFHHDGDLLVLEMEFAPGGSLSEYIARSRQPGRYIPIDEGMRIIIDIARGLSVLHKNEIVHRDLHPGNVLIDSQGKAKVADLGSAQVPHGFTGRTLRGSLAPRHPGHPDYRSPEHENSARSLPPASDVYMLGAIAFELLTGFKYCQQRPGTRSISLRSDIPVWLDDLLSTMLTKEPENRRWDGGEVVEMLKQGIRIEEKKRKEEQARTEDAARKKAEQQVAVIAKMKQEINVGIQEENLTIAEHKIDQLEELDETDIKDATSIRKNLADAIQEGGERERRESEEQVRQQAKQRADEIEQSMIESQKAQKTGHWNWEEKDINWSGIPAWALVVAYGLLGLIVVIVIIVSILELMQ